MEHRFRNVLVVDDDRRWFIPPLLRSARYQCDRIEAVTDPRDVDGVAEHLRPDLAIVDLFFDRAPLGVIVIERLRARYSNLVIVLASGAPGLAFEHVEKALRAGAVTCIEKPFAFGDVLVKLATIPPSPRTTGTLDEIKWDALQRALADHDGNKVRAAKQLGMARQTLQKMLKKPPRS